MSSVLLKNSIVYWRLFFLSLILPLAVQAQRVNTYSYRFGTQQSVIKPFNRVDPITGFEYRFYTQSKDLSNQFITSHQKNQLLTPEGALLSNLCSTDLNWYNSTMSQKENNKDFNREAFDLRKGKNFSKSFLCQIVAQANFMFHGKKHMIYIYKTNAYDGKVSFFDRVFVQQTPQQWLLSNDARLQSFSAFLYLDPVQFCLLFDQMDRVHFKNEEFVREYVYDYHFRVDNGLYTKMVYQQLYNPISVFDFAPQKRKDDYVLTQAILYLEDSYSKNQGGVYVYEKSKMGLLDDFSVFNSWMESNSPRIFNQTPEEAFTSFLFLKDSIEVKKHLFGFTNLSKNWLKYHSFRMEHTRIEWDYKLVFSDSLHEYALIYYSEFLCNRDANSACNEEWLGEKSVLLQHNGTQWFVCVPPPTVLKFVESMNMLSKDAIVKIFGNPSFFEKGNLQEQFLVKGILTYPEDNRVVINQLESTFFGKDFQQKFPNSVKRYWKVMGVFDVFGDRELVDWVLRY